MKNAKWIVANTAIVFVCYIGIYACCIILMNSQRVTAFGLVNAHASVNILFPPIASIGLVLCYATVHCLSSLLVAHYNSGKDVLVILPLSYSFLAAFILWKSDAFTIFHVAYLCSFLLAMVFAVLMAKKTPNNG